MGDLVRFGHRVGCVVACLFSDGALSVAVEVFEQLEARSEHAGLWTPLGRHETWLSCDVISCLAWYQDGGDFVVVLM